MSEAVNHEVLDRLAELLPDLRERAQETEDLRRIPDQSVKQLHGIGFVAAVALGLQQTEEPGLLSGGK